MPYGVCLVDLQGKIIYWNRAAERISGYTGPEVLGRTYRGDLVFDCEGVQSNTTAQCSVEDVLRAGTPAEEDPLIRHKQGHRVPIHVSAFPLRDSTGEMRGVGEIFDLSHGKQECAAWAGHSDRGFEVPAGLPSFEESRERLQVQLRSRSASSAALILIEMSEQQAIQQHGGTALLRHAIRVLAKTVAGLLPSMSFVGCWSDWRLIAIVPDCKPETIKKLNSTLAVVESSCAVNWWGDRIEIGIHAAARQVDVTQAVAAQIERLEQDLKNNATDRKE